MAQTLLTLWPFMHRFTAHESKLKMVANPIVEVRGKDQIANAMDVDIEIRESDH